MRLFRTRSVVVQAVQVTGFNDDALRDFCGPRGYRRSKPQRSPGINIEPDGVVGQVRNDRLGAWLDCRIGDWVERDSHGGFMPVRAEHARARYQPLHG